jgi:hypothetical protein
VVMATAQYWRSVWSELEPHMRLHLAQAFSNRAPRGRKHDFKDAERLVRRLIANELILSFVPSGGAVAVHRGATGGCFDGKSTARASGDVGFAAWQNRSMRWSFA